MLLTCPPCHFFAAADGGGGMKVNSKTRIGVNALMLAAKQGACGCRQTWQYQEPSVLWTLSAQSAGWVCVQPLFISWRRRSQAACMGIIVGVLRSGNCRPQFAGDTCKPAGHKGAIVVLLDRMAEPGTPSHLRVLHAAW